MSTSSTPESSWHLVIIGIAQSCASDRIDLGSKEIGKLVPFSVISIALLLCAREMDVDRGSRLVGGLASLRFTEQTRQGKYKPTN